MLTEVGRAFAEGVAASRECHNACVRQAAMTEGVTAGEEVPTSEGVLPLDTVPEDVEEDLTQVEPNVDVPEVYANVVIEEQANVSIRSDKRCNPSSANYDMKIPPATYDEAVLQPDHDFLSGHEEGTRHHERDVCLQVVLPATGP